MTDLVHKLEMERQVMSVLRAFAGKPGHNASASDELSMTPDGRLLLNTQYGWKCIAVKLFGKIYIPAPMGYMILKGELTTPHHIFAILSRDMGTDHQISGYTELTDENIEELKLTIALKGI